MGKVKKGMLISFKTQKGFQHSSKAKLKKMKLVTRLFGFCQV